MSFDFKDNWIGSGLDEMVTYNGLPVQAIVNRNGKQSFSVQGMNNPIHQYTIDIEVSSEDVPAPVAARSGGDTVTLIDEKGVTVTLHVAEKIRYCPLSKSFTLGLA